MVTLTPLFSGSHGNCTLIQTSNQNILLDCGYGFRAIVSKLKRLGVDASQIAAIVVTHEHSDHVSALTVWQRHFHTKVYCPVGTATALNQYYNCTAEEVDGPFDLGDTHVDVYQCSHDAKNCFGYRFCDGKQYVASVTDTGVVTAQVVPFLAPCKSIILESNHDVDMLWNGPYPYPLKQRVAGPYGHLSNAQAAEVLQQLLGTNVKHVILGHISQNNNTKQLALETAQKMYAKNNVSLEKDVHLYAADQDENGVTV